MTKFDAKNQATGEVVRFDSVPVDVAAVLNPGAWTLEEVVAPEYALNVLGVVFTTTPLVSGSATAGATLTVSGTATSAVAYESRWQANGVLIPGATSATYATDATLDLGKTFVGEMRAQDVRGRWTSWVPSSNSITIPGAVVYAIPDGEWTSVEDPDDAETRQTLITATPTVPVPVGKKLRWYKGTTNPTDASMFVFLTDMTGTGPYIGDSVGAASVGQLIYARIALTNSDNSSPEWVTSIKSYATSNAPSAPGAFTATPSATTTGVVSIDPNDTAPATNGRPILEYGYSQNNGAPTAFSVGTTSTIARDVILAGIDPISLRVHARNANGWSVGSAPQTVTPPNITGGANTTTPILESAFYGQGWYEANPGNWTGTPTFTYDLEQSNDGTTGWTSTTAAWVTATPYTVGMRRTQGGSTYVCLVAHTSGTFATDLSTAKWELATATVPAIGILPKTQLDGEYIRLKVIPSAGSPAYSAATLVRPSYDYVLHFDPTTSVNSARIERAITSPFLGYDMDVGGIWMSAFVYWDGTTSFDQTVMGMGRSAETLYWMALTGNSISMQHGSGVWNSVSDPVVTAQPGWYLTTGWFYKVAGAVKVRHLRNSLMGDEFSITSAMTLTNAAYDNLRLGGRGSSSQSTCIDGYACGFSVGTGNPQAFHDWVVNDGQYRNPLDYNFGTDPYGATIGFHERGYRQGAATWTVADGVDEIGTLDTVTATGAILPKWTAPADVLPPFIKTLGPALAVPAGFITPEFVFAGTQQSFQFNGGVGVITDGAMTASPWVTATSYAVGARVTQGGVTYICVIAHTSGTFATDLTAVRWKNYTITSLTHSGWPVGSLHCPEGSTGLGNISGTVVNGIFTCTTPGELSASVNIGGVSLTLTGAIYPAVAMPATPRDHSLFNGNGLVAGFEQYPTQVAGSTFVTAAALASAIGALGAGTTLIVEDLSDLASVLTIPAKDYAGAKVIARNLHGVKVASMTVRGVRNLTIRGVECVAAGITSGAIGSQGVHDFWLDHCKSHGVVVNGYTPSTSIFRLTNYQTPETALAARSAFASFKTVIVLRAAWGDTLDFTNDTVRVDSTERHVVKRVYVGDNLVAVAPNPASPPHPDQWQAVFSGPLGYSCGVYEDMVFVDQSNGLQAQGLFLKDISCRGMFVNRVAVSASLSRNIQVGNPLWNVVVTNNMAQQRIQCSPGIVNGVFAKNNAHGPTGGVVQTPAFETGTLSLGDNSLSPSTVWPNWDVYPLSWRRWSFPAPGYETTGAFAFINELEAKRAALTVVVPVDPFYPTVPDVNIMAEGGAMKFPEGNNGPSNTDSGVKIFKGALYQSETSLAAIPASTSVQALFAIVRLPKDKRFHNEPSGFGIFGHSGSGGNRIRLGYYPSTHSTTTLRNRFVAYQFGNGGSSVNNLASVEWTEDEALVVFKCDGASGWVVDWYNVKTGAKVSGAANAVTIVTAAITNPTGTSFAVGGNFQDLTAFTTNSRDGGLMWPGEIEAVGMVRRAVSDAEWTSIAQGADIITTLGSANVPYLKQWDPAQAALVKPSSSSDPTSNPVPLGAGADPVAVPASRLLPGSTIRRQSVASYFTIDLLSEGWVYGLTSGQIKRMVPFAGTAGGYTGNVEVRVYDSTTGDVVRDWTVVGAIAAGVWSGSIELPKANGWWFADARVASAPSVKAYRRTEFAVGYKFLLVGQSQLERAWQPGAPDVTSTFTQSVSLAVFEGASTAPIKLRLSRVGTAAGRSSTGAHWFGQHWFINQFRQFDATTPVMIIPDTVVGTGMRDLYNDQTPGTRLWAWLQAKLDYWGNDVSVVAHQWATNDSNTTDPVANAGTTNTTVFKERMDALFYGTGAAAGLYNLRAAMPNAVFAISPTARYCASVTVGSVTQHNRARAQVVEWAGANGATVGPPVSDFRIEDAGGPHQPLTNSAGSATLNVRLAITCARALGLDTSQNPYFTTAVRTGAPVGSTITINVALPNGGTLYSPAPTAIRSFEVNDGGSGSFVGTGFTAAIVGNTVVLTKTTGQWAVGTKVQYLSNLENRAAADGTTEEALMAGSLYETWGKDVMGKGMPLIGSLVAGKWTPDWSVTVS